MVRSCSLDTEQTKRQFHISVKNPNKQSEWASANIHILWCKNRPKIWIDINEKNTPFDLGEGFRNSNKRVYLMLQYRKCLPLKSAT
jgi:hypothetical protein